MKNTLKTLPPYLMHIGGKHMKEVINGVRYNTETAKIIGYYSNNLGPYDPNRISETLYKTRFGHYFLAGHGGRMTKYATPIGNRYNSGSGIVPISKEEALEWTKLYLSHEIVKKFFSKEN